MSLHTKISLMKSIVRIFGFAFLLISLAVAVIALVVAETIGIVEELVVE